MEEGTQNTQVLLVCVILNKFIPSLFIRLVNCMISGILQLPTPEFTSTLLYPIQVSMSRLLTLSYILSDLDVIKVLFVGGPFSLLVSKFHFSCLKVLSLWASLKKKFPTNRGKLWWEEHYSLAWDVLEHPGHFLDAANVCPHPTPPTSHFCDQHH